MSNFKTSILKLKYFYIIIFSSLLFAACGEDDEPSIPSLAIVEIDGETIKYEVVSAQYSYITRRFRVDLKSDSRLLNLFIRADDPNLITTGNIDTSCEFIIEIFHDGLIGATSYSEVTSEISIDKIEKESDTYIFDISGSNIEVESSGFPTSGTVVLSSLELSIPFEIPTNTELDKISFSISGTDYTYYGDRASGYLDRFFFPNPSPEDVELIISANTLDENPRTFTAEGLSIIDVSPQYPPVKEVLNGHQDGLRLSFLKPEFEGCSISNQIYYNNGDNQEENFNSTKMEITNVEEKGNSYILTGTFSGKITQDGGDLEVLDISNGEFTVSVPKL